MARADRMTMTIADGVISFQHPRPPKGRHKTYAPWLDHKLEKVPAIVLGDAAYHQLVGAILSNTDRCVLRERRTDNKIVAQVGDMVFIARSNA